MTVGIYMLWYHPDQTKVYIGRSSNIEQRYKAHCSVLKANKHPNSKLQDAYKGEKPYGKIVEKLEQFHELLVKQEVHHILEFDSVENGFNLNYGEQVEVITPDTYENNQVRKAFELMVADTDEIEICYQTGLTPKMLQGIRQGKLFNWLVFEYPVEYAIYQKAKQKPYKGNWNEVLAARAVWGH